jgi:hypothetical protein
MTSFQPRTVLGAGPLFPCLLTGLVMLAMGVARGQEIEQAPIHYTASTPKNAVAELQTRIAEGKVKLEHEPGYGYLRSLLRELDIPISSQVLVFSKTSLQRDRISPRTPRAVYYNDDVMIGFCRRGKVIEITAVDEVIGTAYYTLEKDQEEAEYQDQEKEKVARSVVAPRRQTESCLTCHASSANRGYPGYLVRSLFVDSQGEPLFARGSFHTDHESPLSERWGGWYVTGTSGGQKHLGNTISRETEPGPDDYGGVNVVDLKGRFSTSSYLSPHSDIVSLMVLEHQVGMLNRLSRAGLETRMALQYQHEMNKALSLPADEKSDSAWSRIRNVGDAVVRYMQFQGETRLTDRVEGTSSFTADFARRGPHDSQGRSLRDFDLTTRLFRHPCSYMIESHAFDSLPKEVKDYIYERLWEILNDRGGKDDPKLNADDRAAIIAILRETKPNLPDYWKAMTSR